MISPNPAFQSTAQHLILSSTGLGALLASIEREVASFSPGIVFIDSIGP